VSKEKVSGPARTAARPGLPPSPWLDRCLEGSAIVWLTGYLLTFFSLGLPSSQPPVKRWQIGLLLPDILLANVLPVAGVTPGSWANFAQRLDLLAVAIGIWCGAWGWGSVVLRLARVRGDIPSLDRFVLSCGVGASAVSLLTLACGLVGWLSPWTLAGMLAVAILAKLTARMRHRTWTVLPRAEERGTAPQVSHHVPDRMPGRPGIGMILGSLAVGAFLLAMLLGSMLPPTDFDAKTYHLAGPKEFFLNGRITFLPHNVYTSFPFFTEMLTLLAMVLRQDWYRGALAGQVVLMGFAPLTALALFCAVRRCSNSTAGWLAAVIFLSTPWTYRLAIIPYVEGALSCYLILACYALQRVCEKPDVDHGDSGRLPYLFLTGWFAGSALACKYPGLVSVIAPLGLATLMVARRWPADAAWRGLAAFALGAALTAGPWLAKNWLETGNPVYPLAFHVFGGIDWDDESNARWVAAHSPAGYSPSDIPRSLLEVTLRSDWLSPLLFGLAPLAWLTVRSRRSVEGAVDGGVHSLRTVLRSLGIYVCYLFATWWLLTHRLDRFWVPLLPIVAWLAAIGGIRTGSWPWTAARHASLSLAIVFNLGFITTPFCGFNAYLADLDEARRMSEQTAPGISMLNQLLTAGRIASDATVLCVGETQVFDARMRIAYNTAFDQPLFREWFAERPAGDPPERDWPLRPAAAIRGELASRKVTHVYVSWEGVIGNRLRHGLSDFVSPAKFRELQDAGVLGDSADYPQGLVQYDQLPETMRSEAARWAPVLLPTRAGQRVFIAWEVYPVAP
jgi:hypothetical protein